jgi:DNA mismatch repair protein MutL
MPQRTIDEAPRANGIRQLPKAVADKIAAGEVVTSPLSVVQDLDEPSVVAGAGSIIVDIERGGKTYIRVTDDGSGIASSEVQLAFAPHATSKLASESDLDNISTLGFRGEALASIAAVSMLEMVTKTRDGKVASRIVLNGGEVMESGSAGAPDGTCVTVRNLFYNTPARHKFMKTDRGETAGIADFMSRMAVAYPDKSLRLITDGVTLFTTPGKGDRRRAILTVFGAAEGDDLIAVQKDPPESGMRLDAWIGNPSRSARTRRGQVFFVNGRYVKDDVISGAVSDAYREFVFEGRHPVAYLFLEIDPSLVDVNVHPTKSEVKFADGAAVQGFIKDALLSALMSSEGVPVARNAKQFAASRRAEREFYKYDGEDEQAAGQGDASVGSGPDERGSAADGDDGGAVADIVRVSALWGGGSEDSAAAGSGDGHGPQGDADDAGYLEPSQTDSSGVRELTDDSYPVQQELRIDFLRYIGSVFGEFIIAADDGNLYMIDWHAAHERVNFERLMAGYHSGGKLTQEMLTPSVLRLPPAARARTEEWAAWLSDAGFVAEIFGDGSLIIKATPAFLGAEEAVRYANDIVEAGGRTPPDNDKAVARLVSRACRSSVKANSSIDPEEAEALLKSLAGCDNPYTCPHGRPVFIKYSKRRLEQLFKRA